MSFNINEMKSALSRGGAKPTLFEVVITNPIANGFDAQIPFLAHTTTLPSSTIGTYDLPYKGRKIGQAGDRVFQPWTVSIFNDEDFGIRNTMETWMNAINSHTGNLRLTGTSAPAAYKSQALVTQFSKTGQAVRTYKFEGIFPISVGQIQLDWNNTDTIETFDVEFKYDLWTVEGITGTAGTNS